MRVGLVVKVIPEKKIGFIRSDDLREDVFFHFSRVEKVGTLDLMEGDEVEYEVDELAHRKGTSASDLGSAISSTAGHEAPPE